LCYIIIDLDKKKRFQPTSYKGVKKDGYNCLSILFKHDRAL
jgi:hypothetical protein